jgi:glycosyltransferase involved in cell wall biosynthesis
VSHQTYGNWELLLVDDGSTDRSTDVALRYAREYPDKIRYLEHEGHENRAPAQLTILVFKMRGGYAPCSTQMIFGCRRSWKSRLR